MMIMIRTPVLVRLVVALVRLLVLSVVVRDTLLLGMAVGKDVLLAVAVVTIKTKIG